jgi:amino acid transporter
VTGAAPRTYRKSLRLFELVSLGVGGTIGSGIFVVPGLAAGIAGPASLIAWVIVAVSACSVAVALSAVQARAPAGTPFYELFAPVFGARASILLVATYVVSALLGIATIAAGLGQYLSYFAIPHILAAELAIIVAFLLVNLVGIALSGTTENILTVIKIVAIVGIAGALAPFIDPDNLVPTRSIGVPELLQVVILVFWPFTGFEISAIPVAETQDPKQIARALLLVMLLVCVIYLGLNVALIGAVGAEALAASPAPIAAAAGRIFSGAGSFVAALGIVTMLSALNAYIVAASRVLQNGAEVMRIDALARLSRRGAPAAALLVSCAVSGGMLFFSNHFDELATATVLATLVPYVAICVSALVLVKAPLIRVVALFGAALTAGILVLYFVL